jgi:hypothetical protein
MIPLIVYIGYGNEHPVFPRAKDLWSFYRGYFPDVRFLAFRSSADLLPDEVNFSFGELTFGITTGVQSGQPGTPQFEVTGVALDRQLKLYKHLLSTHREPFWLYGHTVTSSVDYVWLRSVVNQLECKRTYAGGIDVVKLPEGMGPDLPANKYFRFVSGAGVLLSSDLLQVVLDRAHLIHHQMTNDLWLSFVLRDIPRTPFLRYDITDVTTFSPSARDTLRSRIAHARAEGHFHFRVKSGRWEAKGELAHDPASIDPLVINETMMEILANPTDSDAAVSKWTNFVQQISDLDGRYVAPLSD